MKTFQNFLEWKRDDKTKTITITCRDIDNTLEEMLHHIKNIGNTGHTFDIVMENKKFEWDGDGSDAIFEIKVSNG